MLAAGVFATTTEVAATRIAVATAVTAAKNENKDNNPPASAESAIVHSNILLLK